MTVREFIQNLDTSSITEDRIEILKKIAEYVNTKLENNEPVNLNFICTHNSRRSHLSQVWAQTIARYKNLKNVTCYSGGTEATALFPSSAKALENSGFQVLKLTESTNPIYAIKSDPEASPIIGFSKKFSDVFNPQSNYGAILTCSSADAECPFVPGADVRVPLTFEDPKAFDGTNIQAEKYFERSSQIATEMKYLFHELVKA